MIYKISIKISKIIGTPLSGTSEKTIMLVGATGSGKTTLLDGIVNYVTGVSFDDPFRFTLVQQEEKELQVNYQVLCCRFPNQSSGKQNAQLILNFYKDVSHFAFFSSVLDVQNFKKYLKKNTVLRTPVPFFYFLC